MHELGMCSSIIEVVEARAHERQVAEIKVRVGSLQRVSPEAFRQSFALASMGTVAEGAYAEIEVVPAVSKCLNCSKQITGEDIAVFCDSCGSDMIEITGGNELILESLTYRE